MACYKFWQSVPLCTRAEQMAVHRAKLPLFDSTERQHKHVRRQQGRKGEWKQLSQGYNSGIRDVSEVWANRSEFWFAFDETFS